MESFTVFVKKNGNLDEKSLKTSLQLIMSTIVDITNCYASCQEAWNKILAGKLLTPIMKNKDNAMRTLLIVLIIN